MHDITVDPHRSSLFKKGGIWTCYSFCLFESKHKQALLLKVTKCIFSYTRSVKKEQDKSSGSWVNTLLATPVLYIFLSLDIDGAVIVL